MQPAVQDRLRALVDDRLPIRHHPHQLVLWGLRNVAEPPQSDEPVYPEHVLRALQLQLQREGVDAGSVRWAVHVPGTGNYVLIGDGVRWELSPMRIARQPRTSRSRRRGQPSLGS